MMPFVPNKSFPTLSVVLCVNRSNPWLGKAIASVLCQDDADFEFLIAANACTDTLWEELHALTAGDPRVRLYRTSIGQLAFNLNFLAAQSSAEYLVRMDADDMCEPHRIRSLRKSLADNSFDVLGSAAYLIDEHDQVIGRMDLPSTSDEITRSLPTRTAFCHPTVAIRREFLILMRGYLGGFVSEDTDLWLRARRAGATLGNLQEPLLRYRVHESQSIASRQGYAEVAAHWLRELLIAPNVFTFKGFFVALSKALLVPWLPRIRRYQGRQNISVDRTSGSEG